MSDSPEQPWSSHPNAPQIPPWVYLAEKDLFAGYFIGAISYGIVIALFFQCMRVLLNPSKPIKKAVKWALVVHTVAMFSIITAPIGINSYRMSAEYIKNREFPGNDEYPPGPLGYDSIPGTRVLWTFYAAMFPLNQWLADGLLLHRCYVIYSMNHWAMTFPYLMYLASVTMGITQVYQNSGIKWGTTGGRNFTTSYYSISLVLNVLLTLMIVTRLIRHRRNLRVVLGASDGPSGLYTAIAAMIVESCALYAVTLLTFTLPWAVGSWIGEIFSKIGGPMQVIAPYLIILRVANRRALTSESISGSIESMQFRSQGSTNGDGSLLGGERATNATEVDGEGPGELGARDENFNAIEEVPL